jgi:hypothetical protein
MRASMGGTKYCSIVAVLARTSIYAVLLAAVCLLVFAPSYTAGITNWDDDFYLRTPVSQRISPAIFTTFVMGNYHPLTILSYAIELQMFGPNPVVLHTTNVVLHAATAILVFILLQQLTSSAFPAFAAALIWAIHPLRVESVVWIAERKDVLCGLFFVAALIAYVRRRLWTTLAFFVLALLSKGMAVSFPLAMLAIDFLQRRKAFLEKIPFFVLSIVFGAMGYVAQRTPGANPELPNFAFSPIEKIVLSCRALIFYLGKLLLPIHLSAFYPYPKELSLSDWLAPLFVILIAVVVALTVRITRTIAFAFLFFFVTIAVILPLVSIGRTMAADRYTYIPSIGFAYALARAVILSEAKDLSGRDPSPSSRLRMTAIVAIVAAVLGAAGFRRSRVWHDSVTLWSSVIEVDPQVALPYNSRAVALAANGDTQGTIRDLDQAIALNPCYAMALRNRIMVAQRLGDRVTASRAQDKLKKCPK